MMPLFVITGLAGAALAGTVAFGSAWKLQQLRMDAREKEYVEQALVAAQELRLLENRRTTNLVSAQNDSIRRADSLRRDAAGARAGLVSLSDAAASALRDAETSHTACTIRAAAIGSVLAQCGVSYQELAERADRHVSDIQTLTEAWPKE